MPLGADPHSPSNDPANEPDCDFSSPDGGLDTGFDIFLAGPLRLACP